MTQASCLEHCALVIETWQHRTAFVIQFRADTDIAADCFQGKVEHVASCQAKRFHSLEELLAFIATVLAQPREDEQF